MSFASETDTGRAFLVRLRKGAEDAPLFLFGGIGADPNELAGVASRTRNLKAMIGVDFCTRDNDGQFPTSVAIMAKRSCLAIRALQPRGPYHLVGYSFGGLIAIEVARLLREAGEEIALLGLIDTRYDSRHWPTGIFLRSQARLIRHHLAILLRSPPSSAVPTLSYRARRLVTRFFGRQMPSSLITAASKTRLTSAEQHCLVAMRNYRPGIIRERLHYLTLRTTLPRQSSVAHRSNSGAKLQARSNVGLYQVHISVSSVMTLR